MEFRDAIHRLGPVYFIGMIFSLNYVIQMMNYPNPVYFL